jgi:ribosome-associated protein
MAKSSRIASPGKKKTARKTTPRASATREAGKASAPRTRAPAPRTTRTAAGKRTTADPARETAMTIAQLALEKKASDVVILDVRDLASYADYFVVMSAESDPQLTAIADHLQEKMKERGERAIGVEGTQAGQWVLIDFADVVVHVFYQEMRAFYDIEGLWADAKRIEVRD